MGRSGDLWTPEIPRVRTGRCGYNHFFIHIIYQKKWVRPKSKCNFRLVKPDPVRIEAFLTSDTVACNVRVQWQLLDTGNCVLGYNIEFLNNSGTTIGIVTGIRNNVSFYCTDDYANSSSVAMWAVRKGVKGTKSKGVPLFETSRTIITDKKSMCIVFTSFLFHFLIYTKPKERTLVYTTNSTIKVGLSPSKKIIFICFNDSRLKVMKNAFCFILKALFVLKIFSLCLDFLGM